MYGSNFCIDTFKPLFFNSLPNDAAVIPFPSEDTTPPVTNTYFVFFIKIPPKKLLTNHLLFTIITITTSNRMDIYCPNTCIVLYHT